MPLLTRAALAAMLRENRRQRLCVRWQQLQIERELLLLAYEEERMHAEALKLGGGGELSLPQAGAAAYGEPAWSGGPGDEAVSSYDEPAWPRVWGGQAIPSHNEPASPVGGPWGRASGQPGSYGQSDGWHHGQQRCRREDAGGDGAPPMRRRRTSSSSSSSCHSTA